MAANQAVLEQNYLAMYKTDPEGAAALIQAFTDQAVQQADSAIENLTQQIAQDLGMENLTNDQYTQLITAAENRYPY